LIGRNERNGRTAAAVVVVVVVVLVVVVAAAVIKDSLPHRGHPDCPS